MRRHHLRSDRVACCLAVGWVIGGGVLRAQGLPDFTTVPGEAITEWQSLLQAAVRLPVAAALGAALALRPRRAGTPPRRFAIVQTQVLT